MEEQQTNVHGARRYLHRLIASGADDVELVYPKYHRAVDRVFAYKRHVVENKTIHLHPSVDSVRRRQLVQAARSVATSVNKKKRSSMSTKERSVLRTQITKLTKRVKALEDHKKKQEALYLDLEAELPESLESLVDVVDASAQEIVSLREAVDDNFAKAEKVIARDERALGKLQKKVKSALSPQVRAHTRQIKSLQEKLKRLEALYKTFQKSGVYDSVQLKQLGERITVTKTQLERFEQSKN